MTLHTADSLLEWKGITLMTALSFECAITAAGVDISFHLPQKEKRLERRQSL